MSLWLTVTIIICLIVFILFTIFCVKMAISDKLEYVSISIMAIIGWICLLIILTKIY